MARSKTRRPAGPRKAIIYVRVSSYAGPTGNDERAVATRSPEIQEERCRAFATAKGWTVVDVERDLDVSGTRRGDRLNRPGLVACRAALRDGTADVILALRLDRLARNTVDLLTLAEEADELGAALAVVDGGVDMTDAGYGRLVLTILAAVAELEAYSITTRTMAGKVAAREEGRWIGTRRPPFGYRKIPHATIRDAWTLDLDPDTAPVAREVAGRLLAGETAYGIAQDLNARGIPTQSNGGTWRAGTVRHIWTHPAMVGRHYWQGDVLRDADGMPRDVFPPALDLDDWHTLRAALGRDDAGTGQRTPAAYLLSAGVARCASCAGPLSVGPASDGTRRYRCSRMSKGACSRGVSAPQVKLDAMVEQYFLDAVGHLPVTRVVEVEIEDTSRAEVIEAIAAVDRAMRELDDDDDEGFALARAQRKALRARLESLPAGPHRFTRTEDTGRTMDEAWAESDTDWRRATLLDILRVVVSPAVRVPGTGHYDPDLSKRVEIMDTDTFGAVYLGETPPVDLGPDD